MTKYYNSKFYKKPIQVENIDGEILIIITDINNIETIYSWYDIVEKNTESIYINKCLLGGFIKKVPKNTLIIGAGGGTFIKYLEDHIIGNTNIAGIDIDKTMIDIAKNELQIKTNNFYIGDAKKTVTTLINENKIYDLILIDVYGGDGKIPKYFEEKLFFKNIKKILDKNGTISINFSNYEDEKEKYKIVHNNLIDIFGKYYNKILSDKNDKGNVVGIYNLNKFYTANNYIDNYYKLVKNGKIIFDEKIIRDTFVEE